MANKNQNSNSAMSNHTQVYGKDSNIERGSSSPIDQSSNDETSVLIQDTDDHYQRALSNCQRVSYGVGHVLNDLTASMWFSYLLVFLHQVNNFDNLLAGNLMLIGQVSDALFTPFIGFESDHTRGLWKIGKRKTWHLVGTICVLASFAFLFTRCITCSHAPNIAQFVYYAPFVVIFQFGWAATQISHLSFSSDITPFKHERVTLQSLRNSFTVVANLSVYGIFVLLFYLHGEEEGSDHLSEADAPKFQILALACLGLGTVYNFIFYMGTKERPAEDNQFSHSSQNSQVTAGDSSIERSMLIRSKMNWKDWLKEHQFYQIALLYMSTRLYINVSQVYFPMYLTETVHLSKQSIALLPLVTYLSSFVMSFAASFINRFFGRMPSYLVGVVIGASSCVWMFFIPVNSHQVYGAAVLMGAAGSLLLITSLSMTTDLIAANTESGAFVFGAMSFTDKLSNGVVVLLIQKFHPCDGCCPLCMEYYRRVQCFVPGGALVVAFVALLSLAPQNIGARKKGSEVLRVMENPVDTTDSLQCSCGLLYTPPSTCSACGVPPAFLVNGSVKNQAQVHKYCDTDDDDDDDSQERRRLLGCNLNTPPQDVHYYTEESNLLHT